MAAMKWLNPAWLWPELPPTAATNNRPPTIMKTATMTHDLSIRNERAPGAGHRGDTWFSRMRGFARAAGSCRRPLANGFWRACVLFAMSAAVGCTDMFPPRPVPAEAYVSKPGGTLAPGDEIKVIFPGAPDLNTVQKIQPTGKVSLPTIGEVPAAGKSVTALQQQLATLYQPHLQDSTVSVSLAGTAAGVYVSGAVLRAGKIPLDRPMTVLEAVMEAGGFTEMANPSRVVVVRTQNGKSTNYVLDLFQALNGTESTPFYVRPYDVIFVKEKAW
jgi:polysaccharide export outer membrane protein